MKKKSITLNKKILRDQVCSTCRFFFNDFGECIKIPSTGYPDNTPKYPDKSSCKKWKKS